MRKYYIYVAGFFFVVGASPVMAAKVTLPVESWQVKWNVGQVDGYSDPPRVNTYALLIQGANLPCALMALNQSATIDDYKMFMGVYMTAKAARMKMVLSYDSADCLISSFHLASE